MAEPDRLEDIARWGGISPPVRTYEPGMLVTATGKVLPNNDGYKVGDIVAIQGTVTSYQIEQVHVRIFSKTDEYEVWVRNKDLTKLVDAEDADEPKENNSLVEVVTPDGSSSIWRRIGTSDSEHWRRTGNFDETWATWRDLKKLGSVTRLYRQDEV